MKKRFYIVNNETGDIHPGQPSTGYSRKRDALQEAASKNRGYGDYRFSVKGYDGAASDHKPPLIGHWKGN
jgi:hypothetical protein